MEENRTTIESLLYRMRKLDEKYAELKWLVSGTEGSYVDHIMTKKGTVSRRALHRLIEELIHHLEEYRSYEEARQKGFGARMEPYHLTDEESSFYRSYLYLLLGLSLQHNLGPMTRWRRPGTWDALIERVSYPGVYKTTAEIDRDLISMTELGGPQFSYLSRVPGGLFHDIVCAYWDVTGEDFTVNITESEREAACKLMADEERYWITHPEEREKWEKEQHSEELDYFDSDEELHPEDMYGDTGNPYGNDDGLADGWLWFFADDKERFVESCRIVRKLYCDILAHRNPEEEITIAIQFYLYGQGLSRWGDDDSFFAVYTYMNKALKASKERMGR